MPEPTQTNILKDPIPRAEKQGLLKPLLFGKSRPSRPPRMRKDRKRKAILEEFDPLPPQKAVRTIQDYQQEILEVFEEGAQARKKRHKQVFYRTSWVIGNFLLGWQMDIFEGHPSGVDVRAFMQEMRSQVHKKLTEEILALNSIKFQLVLKVQLQKESPDGTEEFTDPVLRHKQESFLQASEIKEALDEAIPHLLELLEKGRGGLSTECRLSGWTSLDMSHKEGAPTSRLQ